MNSVEFKFAFKVAVRDRKILRFSLKTKTSVCIFGRWRASGDYQRAAHSRDEINRRKS